jgi:hypothetical protein
MSGDTYTAIPIDDIHEEMNRHSIAEEFHMGEKEELEAQCIHCTNYGYGAYCAALVGGFVILIFVLCHYVLKI